MKIPVKYDNNAAQAYDVDRLEDIETEVTSILSFVPLSQDKEILRSIASIVELCGGDINMCSNCGAWPLTVNCNNARCQSV